MLLALPAIGAAVAILFLSSRPGTDLPPTGGFPGADKLLHVVEYFVFGLLLLLPLRDLTWRRRGLAAGLGIPFAGVDETLQSFIPGRFGDPVDFAMDAVGLVLAVMAELTLARRGK